MTAELRPDVWECPRHLVKSRGRAWQRKSFPRREWRSVCLEQSEPKRGEQGLRGQGVKGGGQTAGVSHNLGGCGKGLDFIPRGVGSHLGSFNGIYVICWRISKNHSGSRVEGIVNHVGDFLPQSIGKVLVTGFTVAGWTVERNGQRC